MKFVVIEGGRAEAVGTGSQQVTAEDVRVEAARRLRASGYEEAAVQSFATGRPLRPELAYLKLQLDFVASTLASLQPIPHDFRNDRYWPTLD